MTPIALSLTFGVLFAGASMIAGGLYGLYCEHTNEYDNDNDSDIEFAEAEAEADINEFFEFVDGFEAPAWVYERLVQMDNEYKPSTIKTICSRALEPVYVIESMIEKLVEKYASNRLDNYMSTDDKARDLRLRIKLIGAHMDLAEQEKIDYSRSVYLDYRAAKKAFIAQLSGRKFFHPAFA